MTKPSSYFAAAVELILVKPIHETPDFEEAIYNFFETAEGHTQGEGQEGIPGCVYSPSSGCIKPPSESDNVSRILFQATVHESPQTFQAFMRGLHKEFVLQFGKYVAKNGHTSATFQIEDPKLVAAISKSVEEKRHLEDHFASKIFQLGHLELDKVKQAKLANKQS